MLILQTAAELRIVAYLLQTSLMTTFNFIKSYREICGYYVDIGNRLIRTGRCNDVILAKSICAFMEVFFLREVGTRMYNLYVVLAI